MSTSGYMYYIYQITEIILSLGLYTFWLEFFIIYDIRHRRKDKDIERYTILAYHADHLKCIMKK